MKSEIPLPVASYAAGFFIATLTVAIPMLVIYSERVKSPYQGLQPYENDTQTNTKRTLSIVDAGIGLRISS